MTEQSSNGHGGARKGGGRKPGPTATHRQRYLEAQADKERGLADLRTMEAARVAGELYERGEVLRLISTTVAVFTEQMRMLPDILERRTGLSPAQCEVVERLVDGELETLRNRLLSRVQTEGNT